MVERGDHMAAHLEHKHRQGQRRGQQRHTFKMRGFFNLAVRRGGRCGVRHRGGGVARGLRSLHNGGIRLCGKRLHHGLFPGEVDADIDHTRHGRQGAFDPPDAGCTGHVFNGIAPRLHGGGVACGRKCGDGILGVETRCHLQRRRRPAHPPRAQARSRPAPRKRRNSYRQFQNLSQLHRPSAVSLGCLAPQIGLPVNGRSSGDMDFIRSRCRFRCLP